MSAEAGLGAMPRSAVPIAEDGEFVVGHLINAHPERLHGDGARRTFIGIAPGFVATDMVCDTVDPAKIDGIVAGIPLGEMADADEIGALTAFLCSAHARHLTGATFDVNGASYVR